MAHPTAAGELHATPLLVRVAVLNPKSCHLAECPRPAPIPFAAALLLRAWQARMLLRNCRRLCVCVCENERARDRERGNDSKGGGRETERESEGGGREGERKSSFSGRACACTDK